MGWVWAQVGHSLGDALVSPESLAGAFAAAVPLEAWFADPLHLTTAFASGGLERVKIRERRYAASLDTEDCLVMMSSIALGRFLRHELGAEVWRVFEKRAIGELRARIGERVESTVPAYVAVRRRPSG